MELVLPNNYVEIQEEEMMYLDGGWSASTALNNAKALMLTPVLAFVGKAIWNSAVIKNANYASTLAKTAWAAVQALWALPWWAKLAGLAGASMFIYAVGTWQIF